jgi:hypothetical protein
MKSASWAFYVAKKRDESKGWLDNVTINNKSVKNHDPQFCVTYGGKLTAKNAVIEGEITATKLILGAGQAAANGLMESQKINGSYGWVFDPSSGIEMKQGDKPLLTINSRGLSMTGRIEATSGAIAGWNIGTATGVKYTNSLTKTINLDSKNGYMVGMKCDATS